MKTDAGALVPSYPREPRLTPAQRSGIGSRIDWLVRYVWAGRARNLATAARVNEAQLSLIRSGQITLGPTRGSRIAEASGCSLEWLLRGQGPQPEARPARARRDWFVTFSGQRLFVGTPLVEGIHVEDIAHGLSHVCRFGGQSREFYSVAQHSVLVSYVVPSELALVGLLHDATEAYLGDVIRPLKSELGASYKTLEALWARVIGERFGVDLEPLPAEVKEADRAALLTERRDLLTPAAFAWVEDSMPGARTLSGRIVPWNPTLARAEFLSRFSQLMVARNAGSPAGP